MSKTTTIIKGLIVAALVATLGTANAVPRLNSIGIHQHSIYHDIDINIFLDREDIAALNHPETQAKVASLLSAYGPYGAYAAAYIAQRSADIDRASHGNNASVKFSIRTVGLSGTPQGIVNWLVGGCERRC